MSVGSAGSKVRFIGQMRGKSYLNKSLTVNNNTNWGLKVDAIYTVREVIEDWNGNQIYALNERSSLFDASCFEVVQ